MRHAKPSSAELGLAGEELAARRLLHEGYRLLGRRLATREAEVDIWAVRDGVAWVVEVKTARVPLAARHVGSPALTGWDLRFRPALSLDAQQRRRLEEAARYLAGRRGALAGLALVEVLVGPGGRRVEVRAPHPLFMEASLGPGQAKA